MDFGKLSIWEEVNIHKGRQNYIMIHLMLTTQGHK